MILFGIHVSSDISMIHLTHPYLRTPCWTKQAAKAASTLHCNNGNTTSRLWGVTISRYLTLTRPYLQYCIRLGAQNMDKLQCIQTVMGQEYLPCEKQFRKQPFQLEKRWLLIDLTAVFPYPWLSRKHSQGLHSSACQSWKATGINQNKRGPNLMQGKGLSWYRQKLKQAAQRCCVVSIPTGFQDMLDKTLSNLVWPHK